jgi:hypothetical protein
MATIAEQMQMRGAQVFPQMPTAPNVNQVAPPQFQSPSVATSPVPSMPQQPTMPAGTPTPSRRERHAGAGAFAAHARRRRADEPEPRL